MHVCLSLSLFVLVCICVSVTVCVVVSLHLGVSLFLSVHVLSHSKCLSCVYVRMSRYVCLPLYLSVCEPLSVFLSGCVQNDGSKNVQLHIII